jgi:mRNA interferase MazF
VVAMITTRAHQGWPGDSEIQNLESSGLPLQCIVRLKIFTLDNRLLMRKIGSLAPADQRHVSGAMKSHLA